MTQGHKLSIFCLLLFGLFLHQQYQLWFSSEGFTHMKYLLAKESHQKAINQKMLARNDQLRNEVATIKESPQLIEGVLRDQLNLVKKNEVFIEYAHPADE